MQVFLLCMCVCVCVGGGVKGGHALVFEYFHVKNYGQYFSNIVALSCFILVNPKLTFFDVNNNFQL